MKKLIALCAGVVLSLCLVLAGCGEPQIADNTEHFDKITKTLKLQKSYEGKNLMSDDGIGEATLPGDTTDGDTTTFRLSTGSSVKVRYQGVDTPESTAGVEPWGKAASKFTNERLHMATKIVIESASGGIPEKDSVGQRPLCYVWYKTEEDDFKCLNLELVENGYSINKEDATNSYYEYFQKAEKFARSIELRLFSKLDDPLYDKNAKEFSVKAFRADPSMYQEGTKVVLDAFISAKSVSSSAATTFTIAQYDETDGKLYTIPLYAGYASMSASTMKFGNLYHIVGTLQDHNGSWQISGVEFDDYRKTEEDFSWTKQSAYYLRFDSTDPLFTTTPTGNCYSDVTVTSAEVEDDAIVFVGTAVSASKKDVNVSFTFTVPKPEGYSGAIAVGKTVSVKGAIQFTAKSGELTVLDYSDITVK